MSLAWAAQRTLVLAAEARRLLEEYPEAAEAVALLQGVEVEASELGNQQAEVRSPKAEGFAVPATAAELAYRYEARPGLLYRPPGADANAREIAGFGEQTNPAEFRELHGLLVREGEAAAGQRARELMVRQALPLAKWTGVAMLQAVLVGLVHHRGLEGARSVLRHLTGELHSEVSVTTAEQKMREMGAGCGPAWVAARAAQERENEEWVWRVAKGKAGPVPDWFREERAKAFGAGLSNRWEDEGRQLAAAFGDLRAEEAPVVVEAPDPAPLPVMPGAARRVRALRPVRVAVVVGHYKGDHGAHSAGLGMGEWPWNGEVAEEMRRLAPSWLVLEVYRYQPARTRYSLLVAECYGRVNAAPEWDAALELHWNAHTGTASYTAMYVAAAASARAVRLGEVLAAQVSAALETPNKGVVRLRRGERGAGAMYACKAPSVLCEPFFGDHKASVRKVVERGGAKGLAWVYVDALVRWAVAEGWAVAE